MYHREQKKSIKYYNKPLPPSQKIKQQYHCQTPHINGECSSKNRKINKNGLLNNQ